MRKRDWVAATLASLMLGTAANAQQAGADSKSTWTFGTHTPGPCSPTGAAHGGCDPGEPAISPSSVMIYTGDAFPLWQGHYFIGGLSGQQLERDLQFGPGSARLTPNGSILRIEPGT